MWCVPCGSLLWPGPAYLSGDRTWENAAAAPKSEPGWNTLREEWQQEAQESAESSRKRTRRASCTKQHCLGNVPSTPYPGTPFPSSCWDMSHWNRGLGGQILLLGGKGLWNRRKASSGPASPAAAPGSRDNGAGTRSSGTSGKFPEQEEFHQIQAAWKGNHGCRKTIFLVGGDFKELPPSRVFWPLFPLSCGSQGLPLGGRKDYPRKAASSP